MPQRQTELTILREMLRPHVIGLKNFGRHVDLPVMCEALGLAAPPDLGSKAERLCASFDSVPNESLPDVAQRFMERHSIASLHRNALQDLLWAESPGPVIPKKARHNIARSFEHDELYIDAENFDLLLDRLFVLSADPFAGLFGGPDHTLRGEIDRHVHRNPGDWSVEELFRRLGAFDTSDRRFSLFLEGLSSAEVCPDEKQQRSFVSRVNACLVDCGVELRETGTNGGYPAFGITSIHARHASGVKNLIFASPLKPDLRFRDAVNNDIEIVTNADKVLVYDRPIGAEGLRWRDLQTWWSDSHGQSNAKEMLYRRLRASLPANSPPQRLLFDVFYRTFGRAVPVLPALIPEVWLHWDPRTAKERGSEALSRFRMDFLLLLPHGVRVVVEVDGRHHYARDNGIADSARYASTMAADRELQLAGYHVFHFGAHELAGDAGRAAVSGFFRKLFKTHGIH